MDYRVLVVGGGYEYIRFLYEHGFKGAKNVEDADSVLFTGGEDVSPEFYGEKAVKGTFCNEERDRKEQVIFNAALEKGIPMMGICRGGQFLNVMCGGGMWQHVNNHGEFKGHKLKIFGNKNSNLEEAKKDRVIDATSTHHQMMRPGQKAIVLGIGVDDKGEPIATERVAYGKEIAGRSKEDPDIEVLFYDKECCLCFQPHPEYGHASKELKEMFLELVDEYLIPHC
jgi:gamma-glutamyl-gamma-aminobutyrate hydrolase PuuD